MTRDNELVFEFQKVNIIVTTEKDIESSLKELYNNSSDPYGFMQNAMMITYVNMIGTSLKND